MTFKDFFFSIDANMSRGVKFWPRFIFVVKRVLDAALIYLKRLFNMQDYRLFCNEYIHNHDIEN